jgi:hypothetical protein
VDWKQLLKLFQQLAANRVAYALIGGVALALWGLVRITEDLDLFVEPSEENVSRLRAALLAVWGDPEIEKIRASDLVGEYAVVRYGPPESELVIDILGHIGEAWHWGDLEVTEIEVEGVPVKVATPRTLYRMKRHSLRLQDQADALVLEENFPSEAGDER